MDYDYGLYENDLVDGESYYYEGDGEVENDTPELTFRQTFHMCIKPTLNDTVKTVIYVLMWCLVYRFSKLFFTNSSLFRHLISITCGCLSLHSLFSTSIYYIISLALFTYFSHFVLSHVYRYKKNRGIFLIIISLSYLCICELWLVDSRNWHRIRGPQMIVIMKSVSLAFDLDIGTVKTAPDLIYYLGYVLCPSSAVFGPWVSFNDYTYNYTEKWSLKSVQKILINFSLALLFLSISTCWSEYFIPQGTWKWFAAYRDALTFRTSHYFICYLSEVTLLLSGYSNSSFKGVTLPLKVEFPRSIVNVVIYWNLPMHSWLKVYVFNNGKKFGNFFAIVSTYAVFSNEINASETAEYLVTIVHEL